MTDYLKFDSTRLSYAEYWRWKPGIPFLLLAARKFLRWQLPVNILIPAEPTIEVVEIEKRKTHLVNIIEETFVGCIAKGWKVEFWYTVPLIGMTEGLTAVLTSSDEFSFAMTAASQRKDGAFLDIVLQVISRIDGGRFLVTGSGNKSIFNPPPEVDSLRLPGRSLPELIDTHNERVKERSAEIVAYGDLKELILQLISLQIQANQRRGFYTKASEADRRKIG